MLTPSLDNIISIESPSATGYIRRFNVDRPNSPKIYTLDDIVGTGGSLSAWSIENHLFTSIAWSIANTKTKTKCEALQNMTREIRSVFALTVQDLADILLVKRPTAYAYLDGAQVPSDERMARVASVHSIAMLMRAKNLNFTKQETRGALRVTGLIILLRNAELNQHEIQEALNGLDGRTSHVTAKPRVDIRAIAKARNMQLVPTELQKAISDIHTGKGYGPEGE